MLLLPGRYQQPRLLSGPLQTYYRVEPTIINGICETLKITQEREKRLFQRSGEFGVIGVFVALLLVYLLTPLFVFFINSLII